jgi:hypothetical protein
MTDRFVIHRLKSKPVSYGVGISHFVSHGEWQMGIEVTGAGEDDENKRRIASDLRAAAEMLDPTGIEAKEAPATAGMESIAEALELSLQMNERKDAAIAALHDRLRGLA